MEMWIIYLAIFFVISPVVIGVWFGTMAAVAWHIFLAFTRKRGPMRRDKTW